MIGIRWIEGGRHASAADEARAIKAAKASLAKARIKDHVAAEAAFRAAMERGDADPYAAGDALAAAWEDATIAACIAATQGWHDPNGGAVELVAWERQAPIRHATEPGGSSNQRRTTCPAPAFILTPARP